MSWNDKKEYSVFLTSSDIKNLNELRGFLAGLEVAGKKVPGFYSYKNLQENLDEVVKK